MPGLFYIECLHFVRIFRLLKCVLSLVSYICMNYRGDLLEKNVGFYFCFSASLVYFKRNK